MIIETLHDNEWLSLNVVRAPEAGVNGYVYSHESRCQGRIVAILPYRNITTGREYLLKSETTPCWSLDQVLSAITGGYEGGAIADDAVREMLEETGYTITTDELIPLGESYASKSADTVYTLYSVDLTGRTPGEAIGDGTRIEAESAALWLPAEALLGIPDPQVSVMYLRLTAWLRQEADRLGETPEAATEPVRPAKLLRRVISADVWMSAILPALMVVDNVVDGQMWWAAGWGVVLLLGAALLLRKTQAVRAVKAASAAENVNIGERSRRLTPETRDRLNAEQGDAQ